MSSAKQHPKEPPQVARKLAPHSTASTEVYGLSRSVGRLLFGKISYIARSRRGGGNVGISFIDFQGLREGRKTAPSFSGLSINRHFHRPLPLRRMVHADLLICSNMVFLACCMRRAASVSLIDAGTRFSAPRESPGRRNCCGRSSESSVSSGVRHSL